MDIKEQYRLLNGFNYDLLCIIQRQLEETMAAIGKTKPVPMPKTASGETGFRQTDRLIETVKDAIAQTVLLRMRVERGEDE